MALARAAQAQERKILQLQRAHVQHAAPVPVQQRQPPHFLGE
jgi:hypothetical protein